MNVSLWAEIHRMHEIEGFSRRKITRRLHCGRRTVNKALASETPPVQESRPPISIVDPYCSDIGHLIEKDVSLSAVRVLEEIRKKGYAGEITLVRNYLRKVRPAQGRIYQEVEYAPGAAMQVDWGSCGSITIGETRRKVSVFVAVLCFSRSIFIEFTLNQSKELFYRSIVKALEVFRSSPARIIVDNLKAAVTKGYGRNAVFHPEFASLCGYYRMEPIACDRYDPESKGIVEGGVRYVKGNALAGRTEELSTFQDYQRLAVYWREEIANVRNHDTTGERPVDRLEKARDKLRPLPAIPYDTDEIRSAVVTPHARVRFDANRYSVPPDYVRKPVVIRADDKRVRVFHFASEIASHARSYEKKRLIVDPEHRQAALARRKRSQARCFEADFDALGPAAETFRSGLNRSPAKPIVHIQRILALVKLYGRTEVLAALTHATEYETFDAAYVQNLIDQERRRRHAPSPIPLSPKRRDLIDEIELDEPQPGAYDALFSNDKE